MLRELGAAEVVKRVFSVHLSGGQAGLWAVLASYAQSALDRTGMACIPPMAPIKDGHGSTCSGLLLIFYISHKILKCIGVRMNVHNILGAS